MTLWRWEHAAKGFPAPVYLSEHPFWRISDLEAWERSRQQIAA
jgi:hypothetical protein